MSDYSLKRHFDGGCARAIGEQLTAVVADFDVDSYATEVDSRVGPLELKDRVLVLAQGLRSRLPGDYQEAVALLVASLGEELGESEGMFNTSWYLMPVARFIEEYGLEHAQPSLEAIREVTRRHTGEFAVRPYLVAHHELTMTHVRAWARDDSLNVRRLASEGIRPRLPWAPRFAPFVADPSAVIEVIDVLIDDPSPYVRKSVANNLNDIAKDHPELAVATAGRWLSESDSDRTAWIVNHGLRTLIKSGHAGALEVVGSGYDPALRVERVQVEPARVVIGDSMRITAEVVNETGQARRVVVDYELEFPAARGAVTSKVFKLAQVDVAPGRRVTVTKRHFFRVVRTRTYRPGRHAVRVQANGASSPPVAFQLEERR